MEFKEVLSLPKLKHRSGSTVCVKPLKMSLFRPQTPDHRETEGTTEGKEGGLWYKTGTLFTVFTLKNKQTNIQQVKSNTTLVHNIKQGAQIR